MLGFLMTVVFIGLAWGVSAAIYRVTSRFPAKPGKPGKLRDAIGGAIIVLGLLGFVYINTAPVMGDLFLRNGEGAMKGRLGQLRQAFTRYRVEKSENPPSLDAILAGSEPPEMPELWPLGARSNHSGTRAEIALPDGMPTDSGKWAYAVGTSTPVFIDCTHTDTRGNAWASY